MNLLEETIDILNEHDLTLNDIVWWGNPHFNEKYPLNILESLLDFEYNNNYGLPNINEDLVIVGHDWWLERFEYDGAESAIIKSNCFFSSSIRSLKSNMQSLLR